MFKFFYIFMCFFVGAFASNTLTLQVKVATEVSLSNKLIESVNPQSIEQQLYLKTNHSGLSIFLSENLYTPQPENVFFSDKVFNDVPIFLSYRISENKTDIGKISVLKPSSLYSLGITVSVI